MKSFHASDIQSRWLVEDHLILVIMPEILTTDALNAHDAHLWTMLQDTRSSVIHLLTDVSAMRVSPPFTDFMRLRTFKHPRVGWSLTVGALKHPLLRFFLTSLMNAAQIRYHDFETRQEALAFARSLDKALVDLPLDICDS